MNGSCFHAPSMPHIQIRDVPASLHRRLKARAAMEGVSMSQFLMWQIERALSRPSRRETLDAIRRDPPVVLDSAHADVLRQERDAR